MAENTIYRLVPSNIELKKGAKAKINISPSPEEGKTVTWKSEPEENVSFETKDNSSASVLGLKGDTCSNITATIDGMATEKCQVLVYNVYTINKDHVTLKADETIPVNDSSQGLCLMMNDICQEEVVTWESNNDNIIKIEENKLIPCNIGSTTVSASYKGKSATCSVTVLPPFTLNKYATTILLGGTDTLQAIKNLNDSSTSLAIKWDNSNTTSVTQPNSEGDSITITGSAKGSAVITATCTIGTITYSESCNVTVASNQLDAIIERIDDIIPQADDTYKGYSLGITFKTNTDTSSYKDTSSNKQLAQGKEVNFAIGDKAVSVLLTSIQLHKEIYKPGCLEVILETNAELADFNGLVTLKYKPKDQPDTEHTVADTYYIFEKKKKGRYVTLRAYSVDKFLTIDKFSQAFTGKLLVDEIIEGTLAKYQENHYFQKFCSHIKHLPSSTTSSDTNPNNLWKYTISNLQHLSIAQKSSTRYKILNGEKTLISNINEEDLKNTTDYYEVEPVLPYNVQFEESFHDFLVRVCNRNGEFLYVEDNNLCIGIPKATDNATALTESGYEIEYTEEEVSCDYTTISNRTEFPAEYYKPIREKDDDFAKKEDYYIPGAISLNLIKPIVEAPHFLDAIAPTAMACGGIFGASELFKKQANDGFKKNFGDYTKDDVYQFVEGDAFGNDFYAEILKNEKLAEQKKLIVTSSTYKHHKLGDTVKVDGNPYVVYQVRGGAKIIDGIIESQNIKRYQEEFEMVLIPYIGTKTEGSTGGTTSSPYPIPLPRKNTIKPSTQRATVSANNDPMRLGRVRVLFDWQDSKDSENASPWINIASPMASKDSGFMFLPAAGDAVMVDFVDGNVENPYVVGAFYQENRLPSYHAATQNGPLVKSITSANGHHLTFTDLPGSKFGANLLPFSYFAKFGFLDSLSTTGDDNKLGGGFELADYYGFYSITGSTHERKVSIKSPFGDVSIDAFQGITISAPSGNIKIEGKNVDIIARNNLSITSGTNIANPRVYSHSAAGYNENDKDDPDNSNNVADFFLLKHLLQPVVGAGLKMGFDLSLYRTWFESIFRPIGGTMLIKSHRFMRLEAGKGQTAINSSKGSLKTDSKMQTTINVITSPFKALGNFAFDAKENIVPDNVWTTIIAVQGRIVNAYEVYNKLRNTWNNLKNDISQKYTHIDKNHRGEYINNINGIADSTYDEIEAIKNTYLDLQNDITAITDIINTKPKITSNILNEISTNGANWISDWFKAISADKNDNNKLNYQDIRIKDDIVALEKRCRNCIYNNITEIWNKNENAALKDLINIEEIGHDGQTNLPTFDEKYLKEKITISHWYDHKIALRIMGVLSGGVGLTGIADDRSWSEKDTGNILLSAEAGKMYRFGADGSFKAYMPDEANAWLAFIIKMIKGAKPTLPER